MLPRIVYLLYERDAGLRNPVGVFTSRQKMYAAVESHWKPNTEFYFRRLCNGQIDEILVYYTMDDEKPFGF